MQVLDGTGQDARFVCGRLAAYNFSQVPKIQAEDVVLISKKVMDGGRLVGGAVAEIYSWNAVYLDVLWVEEAHRGRGLGRRLLAAVEEEAAGYRCTLIHLDTFDFQAKGFYLKCGYEVFGVLEGCPEGHCRYYLKKELKGEGAGEPHGYP